jgi:hypothetical protein
MRTGGALGAVFIFAIAACGDALDVDRCLDSGGSFDYVTGRCDFEKSHPGPADGAAMRPLRPTGRSSAVSEEEHSSSRRGDRYR